MAVNPRGFINSINLAFKTNFEDFEDKKCFVASSVPVGAELNVPVIRHTKR